MRGAPGADADGGDRGIPRSRTANRRFQERHSSALQRLGLTTPGEIARPAGEQPGEHEAGNEAEVEASALADAKATIIAATPRKATATAPMAPAERESLQLQLLREIEEEIDNETLHGEVCLGRSAAKIVAS